MNRALKDLSSIALGPELQYQGATYLPTKSTNVLSLQLQVMACSELCISLITSCIDLISSALLNAMYST